MSENLDDEAKAGLIVALSFVFLWVWRNYAFALFRYAFNVLRYGTKATYKGVKTVARVGDIVAGNPLWSISMAFWGVLIYCVGLAFLEYAAKDLRSTECGVLLVIFVFLFPLFIFYFYLNVFLKPRRTATEQIADKVNGLVSAVVTPVTDALGTVAETAGAAKKNVTSAPNTLATTVLGFFGTDDTALQKPGTAVPFG